MAGDTAARVEHQHHEAFTIGCEVRSADDMETPVIGGGLRVVTELHVVRGGTFAQGNEFPFLRLF